MKNLLEKIKEIRESYEKEFDDSWNKMNKRLSKVINEDLIQELNRKYKNTYIKITLRDTKYYLWCKYFHLAVREISSMWDEVELRSSRGYYFSDSQRLSKVAPKLTIHLKDLDTVETISEEEYYSKLKEVVDCIAE